MIRADASCEDELQLLGFAQSVFSDLCRMERCGHNDFCVLNMLVKLCKAQLASSNQNVSFQLLSTVLQTVPTFSFEDPQGAEVQELTGIVAFKWAMKVQGKKWNVIQHCAENLPDPCPSLSAVTITSKSLSFSNSLKPRPFSAQHVYSGFFDASPPGGNTATNLRLACEMCESCIIGSCWNDSSHARKETCNQQRGMHNLLAEAYCKALSIGTLRSLMPSKIHVYVNLRRCINGQF